MKLATIVLVASLMVIAVSSKAIDTPKETELAFLQPRVFGFLTDFYNLIVAEPINTLASSLAAMAAQFTAGLAINGIGKRSVDFDVSALISKVKEAVMAAINTIVEKLASFLSQISAELPMQRGWSDFFKPIVDSLYDLANTGVQQAAMAITQALINFSQGKREVADIRGIFDNLLESITSGIYDLGNTLVQQTAMAITQALINFSQGKRDLSEADKSWFNNLDNAVMSLATMLTQILLNIQNNGILPVIGGGKGYDKPTLEAILNQLQELINNPGKPTIGGGGSHIIGGK